MPSTFRTQQEARRFAARAFKGARFAAPTYTKTPTFHASQATDEAALERRERALDQAKKRS